MDQTVVAQATFRSPAQRPGMGPEMHAADIVTLARMEIGGARFVLPLSDIAAVIEPSVMERHSDDPHGIWIGHVRSRQGAIAVADGSALIQTRNKAIPHGRIAILRGEVPVGLAVDRMLSAQTINRDEIIPLSTDIPALQSCPVIAGRWDEADELELFLDRELLISELETGLLGVSSRSTRGRQAQQTILRRYGSLDYRRGLEVQFDASPERWIVPMSTVRLVTASRDSHELPRTAQKITGVVAWRRKPIPVIDPSFVIDLPRRVSLPAHYVVIGEPASVGETSTHADAAIIVDRVAGIHNNLRIEHGYAWDTAGDALNIIRISDILA